MIIRIHVCDRPEKYEQLKSELRGNCLLLWTYSFVRLRIFDFVRSLFKGFDGITVHPDGHHVSRMSDFILYSVEAEFIDRVVGEYGPCESV